jgi:hypothetical protein
VIEVQVHFSKPIFPKAINRLAVPVNYMIIFFKIQIKQNCENLPPLGAGYDFRSE